ncbi:MAG: ATP-binding protein [Verrucomicrobiales bacterium]|nr:ATP-binding protein [Verrucomicrobiales bacterium]
MAQLELFKLLSKGLERTLRDMNPWWQGDPIPAVPPIRRWAYEPVLGSLRSQLSPAVVLRGPRQVGKSTLLAQVIDSLLAEGISPRRIFRVQFDDLPDLKRLSSPITELGQWYCDHILGKSYARAAADGEAPCFVLDEVQNLPDWAPQLKHILDIGKVRALVTGSSALRIQAGHDSLAGRLFTVEMGPLLLREIAAFRGLGSLKPQLGFNGLGPLKEKEFWLELRAFGERHSEIRQTAFAAFSERGAYPVAQANPDEPWERVADVLEETVIRRAIQHDLRMGPRGQKRDEALLEEVFRLTCRYAGQAPRQALYLDELRRSQGANLGWPRVLSYLRFLDGTLLLRLIKPLELRLKRKQGASKLCLCDHALRAAWLQEQIPLDPPLLKQKPELANLAGHLAESATGYFLSSVPHLDVAHFPERAAEREVDFVVTIGDQRIPIEVKYRGRITAEDVRGLQSFVEKPVYRAPFGLLLTRDDQQATDDPRIISLPLSTLLLMR